MKNISKSKALVLLEEIKETTKTNKIMKLIVNTVEGKTTSKGCKQGRTYQLLEESAVKGFWSAITDTNKEVTVWNVKGDWSIIGLCRKGVLRYTYTSDFIIE